MDGVDGGQHVEKSGVRISAKVKTATGKRDPRQDLRRNERRSERGGNDQPTFCGILDIAFDGGLREVIRDAACQDDRGADPDLNGQSERLPLGNVVCRAADEAAISRLYGGIHYRAAVEVGAKQGRSVGEFVSQRIVTRKKK